MNQMTQIQIITTSDQLEELFSAMLKKLPSRFSAMPEEAVELELLRRKEYLTETEVEKLFGLNRATLRKRRLTGDGPTYSKDGGRVLYARQKIEQYLESRRQKTYDQP